MFSLFIVLLSFSKSLATTELINVKTFDFITNKDEAKAMAEHIPCDCKCQFNSTTCNAKQK